VYTLLGGEGVIITKRELMALCEKKGARFLIRKKKKKKIMKEFLITSFLPRLRGKKKLSILTTSVPPKTIPIFMTLKAFKGGVFTEA